MYLALKHSHMLLVLISIVLFNLRFWRKALQPARPNGRLLKVLPHVNDTLLLASGAALMLLAGWQPFGPMMWLGTKLVLLPVYILLGMLAMKATPNSGRAWLCYLLAMACVALMVALARWKLW